MVPISTIFIPKGMVLWELFLTESIDMYLGETWLIISVKGYLLVLVKLVYCMNIPIGWTCLGNDWVPTLPTLGLLIAQWYLFWWHSQGHIPESCAISQDRI